MKDYITEFWNAMIGHENKMCESIKLKGDPMDMESNNKGKKTIIPILYNDDGENKFNWKSYGVHGVVDLKKGILLKARLGELR